MQPPSPILIDETPAQQLRGVSIEVLDNSVCRYYYGDLVTDLMMCTSGEGGSGPCGVRDVRVVKAGAWGKD